MNLSDLSNASESTKRRNPGLLRPGFDERDLPTAPEWDTPEKRLHEQILEACRQRGWICFHSRMDRRTTTACGLPDFVILADGGRLFLVECKSRTAKLRPEQAALAAHARKLGHEIHLCRSLADFLTLIAPVAIAQGLGQAHAEAGG